MNTVVNKKPIFKNSISGPTEKKQKNKEKCLRSPITKKSKTVRKSVAKVKKVVRNVDILSDWAEKESSKPEIYKKPKTSKGIQRLPSDDSVILVQGSENRLHTAIPIIDLTQSPTHSLHDNMNLLQSKSLKTIYFPSRNFDRNIKLRKTMATTSLITLPVIQKQNLPRKLNSTTILSCTDNKKLGVLDIPKEYLNSPDVCTDYNSFLEKSKLTKVDHRMIDWILEVERLMNNSISPSISEYSSSVDGDESVGRINLCKMTPGGRFN
ncbi:hypothetical protein NQ315_003402 [Exocentrus adspersus]|uniref:Uncharacterized protein n=1 Tax=Exocentrus adspersus TaxID=1586481 RepID=A0AAV8VMS4_9CUCU|nr:hypothetical protein NQ315_003402 [Exocentrus adspersus]